MFNVQQRLVDSGYVMPHLELEKQFKEDNPDSIQDRGTRGYINRAFFQWLTTKFVKEDEYGREFASAIDLITRKNLTSRRYLGYTEDYKDDMYEYAMYRCMIYIKNNFDDKKDAFNYVTTIVRNAFNEVATSKRDAITKLKEMQSMHGSSLIFENVDIKKDQDLINEFKGWSSDGLYRDDGEDSHVTEFWKFMEEHFGPFKKKKLPTQDPRLPKTIQFTTFSPTLNAVIEYIDITKENEHEGVKRNHYDYRAKTVLRNNHQYFAVFSDEWIHNRFGLLRKLVRMKRRVHHPTSIGLDPMKDYIENFMDHEDKQRLGFEGKKWYLVLTGEHKRIVPESQDANHYLELLNKHENCSRVYDCGVTVLKDPNKEY